MAPTGGGGHVLFAKFGAVLAEVVPIIIAIDVLNTHIVPATKSVTVCPTSWSRYIRMTELIAIVHIRPAMIIEVLPSAFDPVVEAAPMKVILKFLRRRFPSTARSLHVCARRRRWSLRMRL